MKYLYSELELNNLKKKSNIFYLFFALDFGVEIAIILICLFLSNYHTKLVFSIVGSIFSIIVVFVFIYLLDRFIRTRHMLREYEALLKGQETIVEGTVIEVDSKVTTLQDGTKVYKVLVKNNDKSRVLLLSNIFEPTILELKTYKFSTYFDYIRGFDDEV